jgi:inner membrane protein
MNQDLSSTLPSASSSMQADTEKLKKALRTALLAQLQGLPFHAYEHCLKELLLALGYAEVKLLGRTEWRQFTRHGGLDIEVNANTGVTDTQVLAQVKQYARPVSRRFVDELRGTMLRLGAEQGLIITLSTFSRVARQSANRDLLAQVRLIDGEELLDLLLTHRIGVRQEEGADGSVDHVDEDYFTKLRQTYPSHSKKKSAQPSEAAAPHRQPSTNLTGSLNAQGCQHGGHMLWRTHVLGGLSSLWLLEVLPHSLLPDRIAVLAVGAAFGALLPDLDASQSKIKHLGALGVQPFAPVSEAAHRLFGHRGFLHSLAGLLLLAALALPVALFVGFPPYLALLLGYGSHLVLDACTKSGIPLWPASKGRFHLLPLRLRLVTGSHAEEIVFVLLASVALLLLLQQFPHS